MAFQIHEERGEALIGIDEMAVINTLWVLNWKPKKREIIRNVIGESACQVFICSFEYTVDSYICEGIHIFLVFYWRYLYLYIFIYLSIDLFHTASFQMIASALNLLLFAVLFDLGWTLHFESWCDIRFYQ